MVKRANVDGMASLPFPIRGLLCPLLSAALWLGPMPVAVAQTVAPNGPAEAESDGDAAAPEPAAASPAAGDTDGSGATAAIVPIAVEGELSDADRERLEQSLVEGLERGDFGIVPPSSLKSTADCTKPKCFQEIAKSATATHVVRGAVTVQDRDYAVRLELRDGKTGEAVATSEDSCEICGVADAEQMVSTAAATLRTKLDALALGPAIVSVSSTPDGAVVTIDGEIAGTTPLEREVVPGKHIVRVSREGFIAIEREVTFVEGVQESLEFSLEKVPSRLPSRSWGWASLGVGIATLGTGIFFLTLDDSSYAFGNNCSGDDVDANGQCRFLWNTQWIGGGIAIAGATLTTLGAVILAESRGRRKAEDAGGGKKRRDKKKARARVGFGPTSVVISGQF